MRRPGAGRQAAPRRRGADGDPGGPGGCDLGWQLGEQTAGKVAERFAQEGLLAGHYDQRDLRQALGDLNQRLRYAAGEYDSPPQSILLPP
jgi:hypothetical protein